MGLKQIKDSDRITFFNLFTKEILFNLSEDDRVKLRIEAEKIKQQIAKPAINQNEAFKKFLNNGQSEKNIDKLELEPSKYQIKTDEEGIKIREIPKPVIPANKVQPPKISVNPKQPPAQMVQKIYPPNKPPVQNTANTQAQAPPSSLSGYKKIEVLLNDPTVLSIECPGPGKNVIVKKYNQTNVTKFTLTQEEITEVITEFSNQARIPVIGGILKAALTNMAISAIISEFVGSRFIITKSTPYSLIYKK
ncbi:Uncharacterised protein [uncultured archaeon]|nr:Uncharacterised protein [uncultured archaeon]